MKKHQKPKPYYVPSSIQKLFVYLICSIYLIQSALILMSIFNQLQQGSDFRPQLGYFAVYNLVPIVVFGIAYFLNPRQLSFISKAFEALLISITAFIGGTLVMMFLPILASELFNISNFRAIEYVSSGLFIGIYAVVLIALRKKGLWS